MDFSFLDNFKAAIVGKSGILTDPSRLSSSRSIQEGGMECRTTISIGTIYHGLKDDFPKMQEEAKAALFQEIYGPIIEELEDINNQLTPWSVDTVHNCLKALITQLKGG